MLLLNIQDFVTFCFSDRPYFPSYTMSAKRAAEGAPEVAEKKAKQAEDEEENVAEEEDIEEEEEGEEGDDEEDVEGVSNYKRTSGNRRLTSCHCRREKRVRTRRERRMMAKKVKTKRAKRVKKRRARVTNKPSQCFNLDCTERGELFSRLDNYQYSS